MSVVDKNPNGTNSCKYIDINNAADNYYFANYLNKARSNLFAIINEVSSIIGLDEIKSHNDDKIKEANLFNEKKLTQENARFAWALLVKKLPYLKCYEYKSEVTNKIDNKASPFYLVKLNNNLDFQPQSIICKKLRKFILLLSTMRNYYSHYYHDDGNGDIENSLSNYLKRKHKEYNIDLVFDEELRHIFNIGIKFSNDRFGYAKIKSFQHLTKEGNEAANRQRQLEANAKKDNKDFTPNKFHYSFLEEQGQNSITTNGLAFFICLFLTRNEASEFLGKFFGLKQTGIISNEDNNTLKDNDERKEANRQKRFRATHLTYTAHCCHLPKPKLLSNDDIAPFDLLLNCINELGKCPPSLWGLLSDADKESYFKRDIKKDRIGNSEANLAEQQGGVAKLNIAPTTKEDRFTYSYLRRGKEDRFTYFALRFLELLVPKIRFQIDLKRVTLTHKFKNDSGNEGYDNKWQKPVYVFANLRDLEKLGQENQILLDEKTQTDDENKPNSIDKEIKSPEEQKQNPICHYQPFAPHYHILDKQVQFCFSSGKKNKDENIIPSIVDLIDESKNFVGTKLQRELPKTIYSISTNDLASLVYYLLFKDDRDVYLQKSLAEYKKKYKQFLNKCVDDSEVVNYDDFNSLCKKHKFHSSWILDKVRLHFKNKQIDYKEIISKRLKNKVRETQELIERNKKNPPKIGIMADYIAKDLLAMMPQSDNKSRINAKEFQELQFYLAYLDDPKSEIRKYFKSLGLLNDKPELSHHFLDEVLKSSYVGKQKNSPFAILSDTKQMKIAGFYENYLQKRKSFLENLSRKTIFKPNDSSDITEIVNRYPFLNLPYFSENDDVDNKENKLKPKQAIIYGDDKSYLKHVIKRYEANPITVIPKGYFNRLIFEDILTDDQKSKHKDDEKIISLHDLLIYSGLSSTQKYYGLERKYKFGKKPDKKAMKDNELTGQYSDMLGKMKSEIDNANTEQEKSDKSSAKSERENLIALKNSYVKLEHETLRYQSQDKVLWEMIKHLIKNKIDKTIDIQIDNADLTDYAKLLDTNIPLEAGIKINPLSIVDDIEKSDITIVSNEKLRDFGSIKTLLRNKRSAEMLRCIAKKHNYKDNEEGAISVEASLIKYEQQKMDNYSLTYFKTLLDFEKQCFEKYGKDCLKKEKEKDDRIDFITYLKKHEEESNTADESKINNLKAIRNSFCHSGFLKECELEKFEFKEWSVLSKDNCSKVHKVEVDLFKAVAKELRKHPPFGEGLE